jgi:surfeit locus 1 family protein
LTPRWVAAHVVVIVVAVVFVNLGFWQLRRLEERRTTNQVGESRFTATPTGLDQLLAAVAGDVESLEYRRVVVTGRYLPEHEVLIRSQVYRDTAGFHVITPLLGEGGRAVLVDRGWVPLGFDQVPVTQASPSEAEVTIEGWVRVSQQRPALGPEDPGEGRLVTMNRVDVPRIQEQVPFRLDPIYVSLLGDQVEGQPVLPAVPTFDDDGPHLAYAIQWFGFALVGLVGYLALIRKTAQRSG